MRRLLSYAESMRGVCVEYAKNTLVCCEYAASMLVEYAKSMRDSSGGKYPILQGEITFVY